MNIFDLFSSDDSDQPKSAESAISAIERRVDLLIAALDVKMPDEPGLPASVQQLLDQGRKIEAIKEYRERFNVDLKTAKDAVEGRGESPYARIEEKLDRVLASLGTSVPSENRAQEQDAMAAIEAEIRRGNKIEAIKLYRELTNTGLKEAKDEVEALERRLRGR